MGPDDQLQMREMVRKRMQWVAMNKERLIEAWLAETGLPPTECHLVFTKSADRLREYVRIEKKADMVLWNQASSMHEILEAMIKRGVIEDSKTRREVRQLLDLIKEEKG